MKTLAHVSDLHFGAADPQVTEGLLADLVGRNGPQPDVIAISGDLTQRATRSQFAEAREFLDKLPVPYVVVPGNHDVPLYDLFSRLIRPLARYRRYISHELMPTHYDAELAVVGLATAHGFTVKDGKISSVQTAAICERISDYDNHWKVLVAHHPFMVPSNVDEDDRVDGSEKALPRLECCGIDVILTGHTHLSHQGESAAHRTPDRRIVSVSSGSSTSTRLRGEPNGYNLLVFDGDDLHITQRGWDGKKFRDLSSKSYRRNGRGEHAQFARTA